MPPINPKIILVGKPARDAALNGVEVVYEAVSATLGPRSANVGIARPFGRPAVVHDGVTVAKEVLPLPDPFENFGAELAVEAADKTNSIGDGTTTATVLMREIVRAAHTNITAGAKPMALRTGIEAATATIVEQLRKLATPIDAAPAVRRIATVSAQNKEIGDMVGDAYEQLGREGIMSVEESRGTDTYLEIKTGMEFDRGFRSPYFVTDPLLGEATVEKPLILVTDHDLRAVAEVGPMMERLYGEGVRNIVIIANDIDGEALAFLVVNQVKQNLKVLAVQAPSFGDKRTEILKDIALVTGATVITAGAGMSLESVNKAMLGTAARITSTKDATLIIDGGGPEEDVANRADEIKKQADSPDTNAFDHEKLMERYAKLKSGVAILMIGAKSEPEIKERKERAIDAISAAKAALSGGIVAGGGVALIEASKAAESLLKSSLGRDFVSGVSIVMAACSAPFEKLLNNAGFESGRYIAGVTGKIGVDVTSGQLGDMMKAGIIDPAEVVTSALENASSSAVMLATTEVIIVEQPLAKKEK